MAKPIKRRRFVDILGVRVKIKYTSKFMFDGDTELHGCFCADTMTIHISTHSDISSTILHELAHATLAISGTGALISGKTEEAIVSALESGLKDYFRF